MEINIKKEYPRTNPLKDLNSAKELLISGSNY